MLTYKQDVISHILPRAKSFMLVDPTLTNEAAMTIASKDFRYEMLEETRAWKKQFMSVEFQLEEIDKEITELAKAMKKSIENGKRQA